MKVIPVIIAGGSGSRLWPESRGSYPKQFLKIAEKTLLQTTIERASLINPDNILVVTNEDYLFLTMEEISKVNNINCQVLVEPQRKNTGPAITLAAQNIIENYGDDHFILVMPADHMITDNNHFLDSINNASKHADLKDIITFGIEPTGPYTGYGYIEVEDNSKILNSVKSFHEKPDLETAIKYVTSGKYLWNSGIFFFSGAAIRENLIKHANEVWSSCSLANKFSNLDGSNNIFYDKKYFSKIPSCSIDHAVMEKSNEIKVILSSFAWNDVGSWSSYADCHKTNEDGNVLTGPNRKNIFSFDTQNTLISSSSTIDKLIVTNSVSNLAVIDTPDALLISDKKKSENVKQIYSYLNDINHKDKSNFLNEITYLPSTVQRPWGTYATLKIEDGYQVKRITVKPNQSLSLQYHHHRAEHWIVVKGVALVQIGDEEIITNEKEYRYIPLGEKHRLSNIKDTELVLIEVQVGDYLGEDDIVRLDDIYGRC